MRRRRYSDSSGCRLVLFAAALFYAVMLAGCAAEGTTRILSYYGDWTGVRPGQRPFPHRGLDFDASVGDPVIAATDGTVVRVFVNGSCGNGIVVQHPVDAMRSFGRLFTAIWTRPTSKGARR